MSGIENQSTISEKSTNPAAILEALLSPARPAIVKKWTDIIYGTYPFDTVGFLRTSTDRFSNPVGYRTETATKSIVDALFLPHPDEDALMRDIDEIMRVRAIQAFSPEVAVGIFFALKEIIRHCVKSSGRFEACALALLDMESRIDAVALMAFGAYARSRETLHLLRVNEIKRSVAQLTRLEQKKALRDQESTQSSQE